MDDIGVYDECLDRAKADLELVLAAFPDEIKNATVDDERVQFELHLNLLRENAEENDTHATITMEMRKGYPISCGIKVISYRAMNPKVGKKMMELTVKAVRDTAIECQGNEEEAALTCCMAAQQVWTDYLEEEHFDNEEKLARDEISRLAAVQAEKLDDGIIWTPGRDGCGIIMDRKSTFQAFVCVVTDENMVQRALHKLISSSNKIQRATHNMYAYRFSCVAENERTVIKHDNDDDGEDGSGSRLAQLLAVRKEDGVLVVVSRWFGGIHLGPKRFAHIVNAAREILDDCHEKNLL